MTLILPELVTQPQVPPHVLTHAKLVTGVPVSGYFCGVYDYPLFMKKFIFFNMGHIFHRCNMGHILYPWQNWTPTLPKLFTQPHFSPHVLAHAKLVTRVLVSGYFCDVYGHPFFMKKIQKVFEYGSYYTG